MTLSKKASTTGRSVAMAASAGRSPLLAEFGHLRRQSGGGIGQLPRLGRELHVLRRADCESFFLGLAQDVLGCA